MHPQQDSQFALLQRLHELIDGNTNWKATGNAWASVALEIVTTLASARIHEKSTRQHAEVSQAADSTATASAHRQYLSLSTQGLPAPSPRDSRLELSIPGASADASAAESQPRKISSARSEEVYSDPTPAHGVARLAASAPGVHAADAATQTDVPSYEAYVASVVNSAQAVKAIAQKAVVERDRAVAERSEMRVEYYAAVASVTPLKVERDRALTARDAALQIAERAHQKVEALEHQVEMLQSQLFEARRDMEHMEAYIAEIELQQEQATPLGQPSRSSQQLRLPTTQDLNASMDSLQFPPSASADGAALSVPASLPPSSSSSVARPHTPPRPPAISNAASAAQPANEASIPAAVVSVASGASMVEPSEGSVRPAVAEAVSEIASALA